MARMELVAEGLGVDRGERRVIAALDLKLASGAALIVTGANGAGKSTLLRALAGLIPARGGRIALGAFDPARDLQLYAGQLHFIGHQGGVKGALTVAENLAFWCDLLGPRGANAAALETFGLADFANMPAAYLSAGQRRRLALTRLVAIPRPLWLLDEPAAGLDTMSRDALAGAIARHCAGGGMVAMASHGELQIEGANTLALGRA